MNQFNQFLLAHGGFVLFLIVFVEQSGVPLPAAPFLLAAGALGAGGRINLLNAIWWAAIGSLAADTFWFYAGHRSKARLFKIFPQWHAIHYALARKKRPALILRGLQMLTAAKFLPLAILVPLRAGALEVGALRFVLVDGVCSLFYVSAYVAPGFIFHDQLEPMLAMVRRFEVFVFILLLPVVGYYINSWILKRIRFRKGRAHKIVE